jgi:FtsZ-binding cell division protein ZapB
MPTNLRGMQIGYGTKKRENRNLKVELEQLRRENRELRNDNIRRKNMESYWKEKYEGLRREVYGREEV